MNVPTGTVTFLFTDIEGSTRLWEQQPDEMSVALARHDALLRQIIETHEGYVFKTIGDAFCAAFSTAPQALAAALAAQRALFAEPWQQILSLRVRMALHTGAAEHRDNDYFGQPLNRVARLMGIGHGGQVLVSAGTQELTRDTLPPGCALQDVGEHRLRDLGRPEPVFQLLHPALPSEFPPLRSLDNPELPNNLPQQVTSFIGREKEIKAVKALLGKTRLLTLTGSGGCGKTRLALQVAAEVLDQYPQGVWLAEMAPLTDPGLVPQSIAQALGVNEEPGRPVLQTLVDHLKTRRLLLVLDNCEHLLAACAHVANTLLRACPHLHILASSREGLGIAGEQAYRIPSLSLPDVRRVQTVESLSQYEAVRLFVERALSVLPQFTVTNANAPALAQLCVRLDGIPLAIELSAARVRSLSVEEINSKLDNRFRLLTGGSRTALPRQQTLRALIDWSYDLLNGQEKTLLCRLSVFAGGWTLEAAEAVGTGGDIEDWEALDLLTSLVDKSLVVAEQENEHTRYHLLETVRQYARDRLIESEEGETVRQRHQAFCLTFAEEAEPHLQGPEGARWMGLLEREHDNLRAALEWNGAPDSDDPDLPAAALRIASALTPFWYIRGYYTEGRQRLDHALTLMPPSAYLPARVKALNGAGVLASVQCDYSTGRTLLEQGLALARELGDQHGIADALLSLGAVSQALGDYAAARSSFEQILTLSQEASDRTSVANSLLNLSAMARMHGDYTGARPMLEQSLTLYRELGDAMGAGRSLLGLGVVCQALSDYAEADTYYQQALTLFQESGDRSGSAYSLLNLGDIAQTQDDYTAARPLLEQSLALFREFGDRRGMALALNALSLVLQAQSDAAKARDCCRESLLLRQEIADQQGIPFSLETFAALAAETQSERAARLWGAAEALREAFSSLMMPSKRTRYGQQVAQARLSAGDETFAAAWAEGRAMTLEQAIACALEAPAEADTSS